MDKHIKDELYGLGYYLVPRGLAQTELAHASACTREVYHLFMAQANHTDRRWHSKIIRRGQLVTSVPRLQENLFSWHGAAKKRYSEKQVRTAIAKLRRLGVIETSTIMRGYIVTVCDYNDLQNPENYGRRRRTNEGTGKGRTTRNKGNEITKKQTTTDNQTTEVQPITDLSTIRDIVKESGRL
jgi:hypothetical protein